jgi:hypothetical protein
VPEIIGEYTGKIGWSVVVIQPGLKLVDHLLENQSPSLVATGGDVVDVFVMVIAARTVIRNTRFPFREKLINTTAPRNVF